MKHNIILLVAVGLLMTFCGLSQEKTYIVPEAVAGVTQPVVSLNGTWQFQFSPESRWTAIQVPGEVAMQGYAIEHDRPFRYRKSFTLPADWRGQTVILRFDGVYSYARLWVNGTAVREHHGGFTRWETDVTSLMKPGKKNEIELEVTDRIDEISYASGYAHHPIGGILRDVSVFVLPRVHVCDFYAETHLDSLYRDAVLRLHCAPDGGEGEIVYTLVAPDGSPVPLARNRFTLSARASGVHELTVADPLKWDAEHPRLYTLSATVYRDGWETYRFRREIGFREVRIVKDRMLINGKPVKLRGACRHDMHPVLGRMTTPELDSLDAVLFKQANMNFVRTSHYPCSEKFLEYCDRLGLYVECETAVCFISTHVNKNYASINTQDNPEYTDRYLSRLRELVGAFRSHPSILFWSLGNESVYGSNFQQCREWLSADDATRPSIFSYPGTQKEGERIYDILSMHYPDVRGNVSQQGSSVSGFQGYGIPALFDEWAHVPCYTYATLRDDPNIREFWGMSLDRMWENIFEAPGGLGGAIWGYIDETFMLPEPKSGTLWWKNFSGIGIKRDDGEYGNCTGYGEWGIVDVWRRLKPEFWSTKKSYSPVRLLTCRVTDFTPGDPLRLPVYNRFDHTNLNETVIKYVYRGVGKTLSQLPSVAPHQRGLLTIPGENWQEGEPLSVGFYDGRDELIDSYTIALGRETPYSPVPQAGTPLTIDESGDRLTVKGGDFAIPFDKVTGLIVNATSRGETVIEKGPFLHLDVNQTPVPETDWKKTALTHKRHAGGQVEVALSGEYGKVKVDFLIRIHPDGQMQVDYVANNELSGHLREAGLAFYLSPAAGRVEWKRRGYWSNYPGDSFAGNEGAASLYGSQQAAYGQPPVQPWHLDTHNYYYWGDAGANCARPLTQQAKGMKENCYRYALTTEKGEYLFSIWSADAAIACRVNKTAQEQFVLYANNRWDYPEIGWGNMSKKLNAPPCYGRLKFCMGR